MADSYRDLVHQVEEVPYVGYGEILLINVRDGRKDVPVKVIKVNPTNFRCIDEQGLAYNVRRTSSVRIAPDRSVFKEPEAEEVKIGMVVRFKEPRSKTEGLFVVIDDKAGGLRVSKLGGTPSNQYFYNIQASSLKVVTGSVEVPAL
jgi:hypothetical protein